MTLTRVVDVASVNARVKRPHMMALNRKLRPKKICSCDMSNNQMRRQKKGEALLGFFEATVTDEPYMYRTNNSTRI